MTLRDLLKTKSDTQEQGNGNHQSEQLGKEAAQRPEFTFLRTTTSQQEQIRPPIYPDDPEDGPHLGHNEKAGLSPPSRDGVEVSKTRRSLFGGHHRKRSGGTDAARADMSSSGGSPPQKSGRKLSSRFSQMRLPRSSSRDSVSSNLPPDLGPPPSPLPSPRSPGFQTARTPGPTSAPDDAAAEAAALEGEWSRRATQLALSPPPPGQLSTAASRAQQDISPGQGGAAAPLAGPPSASGKQGGDRPAGEAARDEEMLQDAIRLHEAGDLSASTALFGRLADPGGANSALAQVLHGLALRHGWGVEPDHEVALRYLLLAAGNAGAIESHAREQSDSLPAKSSTGRSNSASVIARATGGPARGELVLAIFELGNCYRHGWGTAKDARAAREYYETAANLGDVDAMEEASRCFLEGFGGAKDKARAARYLRLAEDRGRKSVGNSWIWKAKYDP